MGSDGGEARLADQPGPRFTVRFVAGMAVYGIVLTTSLLLLNGDVSQPWRTVIALTPVIPVAYLVWVVVARIRSLDEYWQRVHLTALPIAFLGSISVAFTWGFLQNAGLAPLDGFVMFGVMVGLYLVGLWIARRRMS